VLEQRAEAGLALWHPADAPIGDWTDAPAFPDLPDDLTVEERKDWACKLREEGRTIVDIAGILHADPQTIRKWLNPPTLPASDTAAAVA